MQAIILLCKACKKLTLSSYYFDNNSCIYFAFNSTLKESNWSILFTLKLIHDLGIGTQPSHPWLCKLFEHELNKNYQIVVQI